jgi:hypothetical protein
MSVSGNAVEPRVKAGLKKPRKVDNIFDTVVLDKEGPGITQRDDS